MDEGAFRERLAVVEEAVAAHAGYRGVRHVLRDVVHALKRLILTEIRRIDLNARTSLVSPITVPHFRIIHGEKK